MGRVAFNHRAQTQNRIMRFTRRNRANRHRELPGTRNPHNLNVCRLPARPLNPVQCPFQQTVCDEAVEAADNDGETQPLGVEPAFESFVFGIGHG